MIYLDNAATTYPKPRPVIDAVTRALRVYGANPGRSGYSMSIATSEEVYRCRTAAAGFFNAPGPECVAFTVNCTNAVNYVLKGLLKPGDHAVVSSLEHNAVMRPLDALREKGVTFTKAEVFPGDNDSTVDSFRKAINGRTKLIICTHASNVWGIRLPVERIAALAHEYGIRMAVDCAQSAGVLPIDINGSGIDYLCAAGHKGLYGPMGTGMLIAPDGGSLATVIEGGTGTQSALSSQPVTMPDRMESGTQNVPGIAGLRAGIEFVKARGIKNINRHEMEIIRYMYDEMSKMKYIRLYTRQPQPEYYVPVLSFNVGSIPSETAGRLFAEKGIAVRAGLHCAPEAHRFMGTQENGAVRVAPSVFTGIGEAKQFLFALGRIARDNH